MKTVLNSVSLATLLVAQGCQQYYSTLLHLIAGSTTCSVLLTTLSNVGSKTLFNVFIRPEQVVHFWLCICCLEECHSENKLQELNRVISLVCVHDEQLLELMKKNLILTILVATMVYTWTTRNWIVHPVPMENCQLEVMYGIIKSKPRRKGFYDYTRIFLVMGRPFVWIPVSGKEKYCNKIV